MNEVYQTTLIANAIKEGCTLIAAAIKDSHSKPAPKPEPHPQYITPENAMIIRRTEERLERMRVDTTDHRAVVLALAKEINYYRKKIRQLEGEPEDDE